ncbi:MAG: hypothetical protein AAFY25_11055 [Pseudomonadota bacterium]
MPQRVAALVKEWFAGRIETFALSGDRSVYIPFEDGDHTHIKIKGAGYRGQEVRFGTYLKAGPASLLFDYDGRRMVDVAHGHDGAFVGGASMQQAVTEWRMSATLPELGYQVVPCPGFGTVSDGTRTSWFSVFRWHEDWIDTAKPPHSTALEYEALTRNASRDVLDLATRHNLVGFFWRIRTQDKTELMKDLHPARRMDPMNYSQISWVMQVCHAMHITSISTHLLATKWFGKEVGRMAGLWMIWPYFPQATLEDWDDLRFSVVSAYMKREPERFRPETLVSVLEANPIAARLMELCPPEYERFR